MHVCVPTFLHTCELLGNMHNMLLQPIAHVDIVEALQPLVSFPRMLVAQPTCFACGVHTIFQYASSQYQFIMLAHPW